MAGYKFIEGLTVADIAFEATGRNLNELFENSALALFEVNVDIRSVKPLMEVEVKAVGDNLENLLFNFLDELIFVKDRDGMVFCGCKAEVNANAASAASAGGGDFKVTAMLKGDKINYRTQKLRVDAKAVTMHMFEVKKEGNIYKARVVVDI